MNKDKTAMKSQLQKQFDMYKEVGGVVLGPYTSHIWRDDPKHLCFLLARYKFCAKLLAGKEDVLEIGCGDSFGTAIVLQFVKQVHGIDIEAPIIEDNQKRVEYGDRCSYEVLDITSMPLNKKFDAAFSLDVIEHIPHELERKYMHNISDSLSDNSVFVIGTPNITAKDYASKFSAESHINLKDADNLKALMLKYFHNSFVFSMNDEMVHTGYHHMAHYLFVMGVGKRLNI